MAKHILYSDFAQTSYSVAQTYPLTINPNAITMNGDFIWFGGSNGFGKLNIVTGAITNYSLSVDYYVKSIIISELEDVIFLTISNNATAELRIEARRFSNPTTLITSNTSPTTGNMGSYDYINKRLYVAYHNSGVRVFNWVNETFTLNTTIAVAAFSVYDAQLGNGKLFLSDASKGKIKVYSYTDGAPVSLSFIKDITLTPNSIRGLYYDKINDFLFACHGGASNSVSIYNYGTSTLENQIFPTNANYPMESVLDSSGRLWIASYSSLEIFKMV